MKLAKTILCSTLIVLPALAIQAQIFKANDSDALNLGTSWVGGIAPGTGDVAAWDATVATAANCTNTLGGATAWGGILVSNPAVAVKISTNFLASASVSISLGASGINLSNATMNLWIAPALTTTADQTWAITNGRTLMLGEVSRTITVANNVALNGVAVCPSLINDYGSLTISPGSALTVTNASSSQSLNVGTGSGAGVVNQAGGAVTVGTSGGTTGSPKASMIIGFGGIYNITGGTLADSSASTGGRWDIPGSTGNGTLNIDGTASVQSDALYIANGGGSGTVNVTNGTLTIPPGVNLRIGVSSGTGTMNVYGGLVQSASTMNCPSGAGTGILNVNGGTMNLNGLNVANTGPGTVTVSGGVLNLTNNLALAASSGTGVLNLNGGITAVPSITHAGSGTATLNWNGGVLKARASSATFIATNTIAVNVGANGAILDTTNFNVTLLAPLLDAGGGGGLTKSGSGTLTLGSAPGTYTGPTVVNAGTLAMATTNHTGGAIGTSSNATLQVTLANATTMNCSSLALGTLGASLGGTNFLTFNLGTGNPAVPIINASSLAATGTVFVAVNGAGFSIGTIHLIQYSGSVAGNDFGFALNFLSGAVGYVTNNTGTHFVDLVITALPNLAWRAQVNSNWDILTTANWVDLNSSLPSTYPDGASVTFDDNTSNSVVNLTNAVNPASVTLNNVHSNYLFGGGGRIAGAAGLMKTGAGTVTMALTNSYNGNTVISNGTFVLGVAGAIPGGGGRGSVTLEGKLDLAGFNDSINGLIGSNGKVDNSTATPVVFSIGGGNGVGSFSGLITNSGGGALALNVSGGTEQLLAKNGYSGPTTNAGNLQLAFEQSISPAPLTLRGGSLSWVDSANHVLTNQITLSGGSAIGASTNGLTTFSNVVNITASVGLTCNSDVLLASGVTNVPGGSLTGKSGPGTLTLNNAVGDWTAGTFQLNSGTIIFNGGAIVQDGNNFRIQCNVPGGLAYCILTNGASVTLSNNSGANLRVGDSGDAAGGTNLLDIAGTITLLPQLPNTGDKFQLDGNAANGSDLDIVNLLSGGVLNVRQVAQANNAQGTFNFDGGTLRAITNDFGATFLQSLFAANVLDGGAIIDDGGFTNITIAQALQAGGSGMGGLTKLGAGRLTLTAANTYTGNTLVNAGTLAFGAVVFPPSAGSIASSSNIVVGAGATLDVSAVSAISTFDLTSGQTLRGQGAVNGIVTVDDGATVAPGGLAAIGTLTFTNAPVLGANSTNAFRVNQTGGAVTNDQFAIASGDALNFNGALVVNSTGAPLVAGNRFYLFSAPGGFGGNFSSITLPPLSAGLGWTNNLLVDGSITVTGAVVVVGGPRFNSVVLSGSQLILSGTNGSATASYRVYSTTNLTLPQANWIPIATNNFDNNGNFIFTNAVNPAKPIEFYDLSTP